MLFLLSVIVFALVAGFAAGGRLRNFERLRIRAWWLAPVGLLLQVQLPALWHPGRDLSVGLLIGSYLILLVFAALNLRLAGFALILIGLAMNLLVVGVNGGMPVTKGALVASGQGSFLSKLVHGKGAKHHLARPDDVLLPLADVIAIPPPIQQVVSAGDLVVYAGVVWLVAATMRGRPRDWILWRRRDRTRGEPVLAGTGKHQAQTPQAQTLMETLAADSIAHRATLIIGDYAEGPYGPIILLELMSVEAAQWLRRVFIGMSNAKGPVQLGSQPGVSFRRLSELELRLEDDNAGKHLLRVNNTPRPRFVWSCSASEWEKNALFLDPFLIGGTGHQYLTDGSADDAILEVSHGESHFSA
jgi:hypothetical protein